MTTTLIAAVKTCSRCKETLPADQFHRRHRDTNGLQAWCRTCKTIANAEPGRVARGTTWWLPCSYCGETFKRVARQGERRTGNVFCGRQCRSRAAMVNHKYGLNAPEFRALWEAQAGLCAMPGCFAVLRLFGADGHHVDHDHDTGRVRGLLCHGCNVGLGWFERLTATGAEFYSQRRWFPSIA